MNNIIERRQVLYWRMLSAMFEYDEQGENLEYMAREVADELEIPRLILDPRISVDNFLAGFPELEPEFDLTELDDRQDEVTLRRALIISKLLLNVFGPQTCQNNISASQYSQWLKDVTHLERSLGCKTGSLRAGGNPSGTGSQVGPGLQRDGEGQPGGLWGGHGIGHGFNISEEDIRQAIISLEKELIQRMALEEVLKDQRLASQLIPSMPLIEQLLRQKSNLSGPALNHAKDIIRRYINELADVLRLQVMQAISTKIDRSVPPKKVFRNLDLKRTIWRNLPNWNPDEGRLYVDRLYYRQTAKKKLPIRLIVVVDQSGSMVDAMVQCTILASIFAGLPHVDVHLVAFDTRVIDLTDYVHDPFEVLLRTQLGGGTYINLALQAAMQKIENPRQTAMILISDFYEGGSYEVLMETIRGIIQSGVHFFPVGAVTTSGYFSVEEWFRSRLKDMGKPVLTGSPAKLIQELKKVIVI